MKAERLGQMKVILGIFWGVYGWGDGTVAKSAVLALCNFVEHPCSTIPGLDKNTKNH